ncbi:DciA family protein [uncultured Corynebacterium sp.]|uniref:DUF721 domain-containing protein n=1 Tax=uncultured Corynebacterium sp. TaxID=159447 RepID=UPI0025F8B015|nr:DciA family protein [uncultured Corynebacterium sp.]
MSIDPVAQALDAMKQAGGSPQAELPMVASPRKKKKKTPGGPTRYKTRMDGRLDRSYRDPKRFGSLIGLEIKRQGWQQRVSVARIMNAWPELVGDKIAEHTRPVRYEEDSQVLVIECDSTPWTTQLRYMQTVILQAIAKRAGEDVVAQLRIVGPNIQRPKYGKLRVQGRGPRDDFG